MVATIAGMPLPAEVAERIEAIRRDRVRGATALTREAAGILVEMEGRAAPGEIRAACYALSAAQPLMAALGNLARAVLAGEPASAFLERMESAHRAVVETAAELIGDGAVVLTHSAGSSVADALLAARGAGKRVAAICTESRPLGEGRALARALAQAGIRVTLVADAAVGLMAGRSGLVLVGADALSPQGLVNKIGTSLVALAAQRAGTPCYALCPSQKFLAGPPAVEPERDPAELLDEPAPNLAALNYYFDLTPLEDLTGVITENGVVLPGRIRGAVLGSA